MLVLFLLLRALLLNLAKSINNLLVIGAFVRDHLIKLVPFSLLFVEVILVFK